jgi:hypothetical protein
MRKVYDPKEDTIKTASEIDFSSVPLDPNLWRFSYGEWVNSRSRTIIALAGNTVHASSPWYSKGINLSLTAEKRSLHEVVTLLAKEAMSAVYEAATKPDASDETRLAAGWSQMIARTDKERDLLDSRESRPHSAPGYAGRWRLHPSGGWFRWMIPEKKNQHGIPEVTND